MTRRHQAQFNKQGAAGESRDFRETEIKFRADAAGFAAVLQSRLLKDVKVGSPRELLSTYYDTAEGDLRRHGMTLRLRKNAKAVPVLGIKWDKGAVEDLFGRGEIEVACPDGTPDLALFELPVRNRLEHALGSRPLAPVFETRLKRRVAYLRHGQSEIELSLDEGAAVAGASSVALSEIELELKSGTLPDLVACAASFARACGLSLEFEPKALRGYRLLDGFLPEPQKAKDLGLAPSSTFDDLMIAVMASSLGHFMANWAPLRSSDAPESVHQLRVALRRMRSALGGFRRVIDLPGLEHIRAEARRIASALGPARDCDVFRQNALEGPFGDGPELLRGATSLLAAVTARREASYVDARRVIDDTATSLFVLDVQDFIARRAWHGGLSPDRRELPSSAARPFAAEVLGKLRRRALKRGKNLPNMSDAERHDLRIALKNLRYAAEFFSGLFDDAKAARGFIRRVAELQEDLGTHNDAATAANFVAGLNLAPGSDCDFAAGYLLGWYRHATLAADLQLARKWKAFRRAEPFWN